MLGVVPRDGSKCGKSCKNLRHRVHLLLAVAPPHRPARKPMGDE